MLKKLFGVSGKDRDFYFEEFGLKGLKGVMILQLTFVGVVDMDSMKNPRHGQMYQDEVGRMNLKDRLERAPPKNQGV